MMQSLPAKVVSIDFTPALAKGVKAVNGVKYETLSVRHNKQVLYVELEMEQQ